MISNIFLAFILVAASHFGTAPKGSLHNEVDNLQTELQMVFERMETQERLIDVLRQEVELTLSSAKGSNSSLSTKFTDLDVSSKALSKDILSLRDHFNNLSKEVDKQGKSIKQLEVAMKALLDAVSPDKGLAGSYKVKSGDSLEKIAKDHGTTPKAIKDLNNLQKDTIYVGQNLVLP